MKRIEGGQDARLVDDLERAQGGDHDEPDQQDRPEDTADPRRALVLNGEQPGEQQHGQRYDRTRQSRRGGVQTLHRSQHADRRGDEAVAEQQPCAEHQEWQEIPSAAFAEPMQQAIECKHAAFAVILRPQHQNGVFDRHDQRQRPDDQGNCPQDRFGCRRPGGNGAEDLVQGIKGRGADIAIDHAKRPDRQGGKAAAWRT